MSVAVDQNHQNALTRVASGVRMRPIAQHLSAINRIDDVLERHAPRSPELGVLRIVPLNKWYHKLYLYMERQYVDYKAS